MVDKEQKSDHVIEHEGYKIVLIHDGLLDTTEVITLDCQETKNGKGLILS